MTLWLSTFFWGHNLCFKYPNGSWEPILNIYVPRSFQWYKKLFNPMSFDPCNRPLKIWDSIETPIPNVGVHLKVWGSFPHIFLHSREYILWLPNFTCTFASLCHGHTPKARVATGYVQLVKHNQINESFPHFQSLPLLTNIPLWRENKVKWKLFWQLNLFS